MRERFNLENKILPKDALKKAYYTGIVSVGDDGYVAKGSNSPGERMPIKTDSWLDITYHKETFPVSKIYFRTISDIYCIEHLEKGATITSARDNIKFTLNKPPMGNPWGICIGEQFHWLGVDSSLVGVPMHIINSTKVVEMVAVSEAKRTEYTLHHMTNGWESSVVSDFQRLINSAASK
jgi:hypothetical protein